MPGEHPFQRFRSGQRVIEPRQFNEPQAALEAIWNSQVSAGVDLIKDPAGWFWDFSAAAGEVVRIQVPAGGIANGVTTACQYYGADHALSASGDTIDVANRSGVLVGDATTAKVGWAAWIAREGEFQVINRAC